MPESNHQFDVIILGAGPAGATAALALGGSGLRVALIDKAIFPRDKICGDCVSSSTKYVLRRIDPALEVALSQFPTKSTIHKAKVFSPRFEELELEFQQEGFCIKRNEFDHWLIQQVEERTDAQFFFGSEVRTVRVTDEGVEAELPSQLTLKAQLILACDGAQSVAARQLAGFKIDRRHHSGAVRQYYKNVKGGDEHTLEVYFLKNYLPGYFWIFPLPNQQANVGFGMLSETIASRKINLKEAIHAIIHELPEIAERFSEAEPLETVKGFGLPLGSKKQCIHGDRFMCCGDAASLIDPFSGEGIELAMESGRMAAIVAKEAFAKKDFSAKTLQGYEKMVYKKMWPTFRSHYLMQRILGERIWLINFLTHLGNHRLVKRHIHTIFY